MLFGMQPWRAVVTMELRKGASVAVMRGASFRLRSVPKGIQIGALHTASFRISLLVGRGHLTEVVRLFHKHFVEEPKAGMAAEGLPG